jgi:hypothetical protein
MTWRTISGQSSAVDYTMNPNHRFEQRSWESKVFRGAKPNAETEQLNLKRPEDDADESPPSTQRSPTYPEPGLFLNPESER